MRAKVQPVSDVYMLPQSNRHECTYNDLLIGGDKLQSFLNDPAAVHLQGQRQHVTADSFSQSQLLVQAAKLTTTTRVCNVSVTSNNIIHA